MAQKRCEAASEDCHTVHSHTATLLIRTHPTVKIAMAEEGEVLNEENRPRLEKNIDEQEEQQVTERQEVRALWDWSNRSVTQQQQNQ